MLRLKYKLYNGVQPQDAIVAAVPSISQQNDLFMGQWETPDGYLYGEINTDVSNKSAVESALSNWNVVFLTDEEAIQRIDSLIPGDTIVQKKIKSKAARVREDGHVVKETEEVS